MAGVSNVSSADEEMAELLQAGDAKNDINADSSESDNDMPNVCDCDAQKALAFLKDLAISVLFWVGLDRFPGTDQVFNMLLLGIGVLMVIWRIYRAFGHVPETGGAKIPYTSAYFASNNKEMFIVATVHIAPRAPLDVQAVINAVNPDVTMIELDEERLDRMRDPDPEEPMKIPEPKAEDLQPITVTRPGMEPMRVLAQRAVWNAEWAGDKVEGRLVHDEGNAWAMRDSGDVGVRGSVALVKRGSADGEWAPFMLKAHNAHKCGATAVLVVNGQDRLPVNRLGASNSGIQSELKIAWRTKNCGFPPVPLLLLPQTEGERLEALCNERGVNPVSAEFTIKQDHYPRRTLRFRLCQACSLLLSGIGVLYGIIGCFGVEVGAEFTIAEIEAKARGIPCACIDVDLNRFWKRLGSAIIPTPCNLLNSLWCWLAFPRVAFNVLFPPLGNVDVMGTMVLHAASFSLRTWVAFILAGFCASQITSRILQLFGYGASKAAEQSGAISEEDRDEVQQWIMLAIQMYILPQVYTSIAASRDEAMYKMIVKKSCELDKKRMVVVVGAAHSNGILERVRARGL